MSRFKTLATLSVAATMLAVAVAGCGDGGSSGGYGGDGSTAAKPTAPAPGETGAATVRVAGVPGLGTVIVDADGFTLYDFHKDKGTTSSCYGACAKVWPPLLTGSTPEAAAGVPAAKLGTAKRGDGTTQVTFAGHPLYTYAEDIKPGEAKGNDFSSFGAEWYALKPSGNEP